MAVIGFSLDAIERKSLLSLSHLSELKKLQVFDNKRMGFRCELSVFSPFHSLLMEGLT